MYGAPGRSRTSDRLVRRGNHHRITSYNVCYTKLLRISKVGSWERDFGKEELYWSDEMYELFGLDRASVRPSYDLFIQYVHPDRNNFV